MRLLHLGLRFDNVSAMTLSSWVRVCVAALLCAAFLGLAGCGEADKRAAARATWDRYWQAIQNKNPAEVLAIIDPKNLDTLRHTIEMARTASSDRVLRQQLHEIYAIVYLRAMLSAEDLAKMTPEEYVTRAVGEGWWQGDEEDGTIEMGRLTVRPPRVIGEVLYDGESLGITIEFVELDGRWVMDWDRLDQSHGRLIEKLAGRRRADPVDFILMLVEMDTGVDVTRRLLDAPKPGER